MTTLVVHGTMSGLPFPHTAKWWWDSWHEGGFLHHLASAMQITSGDPTDDVWRIGGTPVSEIAQLSAGSSGELPKTGSMPEDLKNLMLPGRSRETYWVHDGHFMWSGADSHFLRDQAGSTLARYLNAISRLAPNEPIRIVAHSHGCNVVKLASGSELLASSVHFERAIFLACPHFTIQVGRKTKYPYVLDPSRFGHVLNLYSQSDSVQTSIAQKWPGPPDNADFTMGVVRAWREEQEPQSRRVYLNFEIPTEDSGIKAHTAMHGRAVGALCGNLLCCNEHQFCEVVDHARTTSLPVPAGDVGAS